MKLMATNREYSWHFVLLNYARFDHEKIHRVCAGY